MSWECPNGPLIQGNAAVNLKNETVGLRIEAVHFQNEAVEWTDISCIGAPILKINKYVRFFRAYPALTYLGKFEIGEDLLLSGDSDI